MAAYYNEIDPYAAAWLRNLIAAGHIAPGDVDERSIADVRPDDLRPYTQCHFFAGIGVWSYALRRAGWPDDLPVWTGSCPCQPFSAAGRGEGFADERHLWPAFQHLIAQRRPPVVFGEQVASKAVDHWIDLVQDDLEGLGYAFGAVPFPSAGVGAPHIRDRAYFVAHAGRARGERRSDAEGLTGASARERHEGSVHDQPCGGARVVGFAASKGSQGRAEPWQRPNAQLAPAERTGTAGSVADTTCLRHPQRKLRNGEGSSGSPARHHGAGRTALVGVSRTPGAVGDGILADADILYGDGTGSRAGNDGWQLGGSAELRREPTVHGIGHNSGPGPTNGFWRDPDWLLCRDGRWRPVEPGTFPLAHGVASRVGRLRAYGNAINAEAATAFISASIDAGRFRVTPLFTMSADGVFG